MYPARQAIIAVWRNLLESKAKNRWHHQPRRFRIIIWRIPIQGGSNVTARFPSRALLCWEGSFKANRTCESNGADQSGLEIMKR
jgi:hypothetical protein